MLRKSARFALALVLSLLLCPTIAFADDESSSIGLDGGYATTQAEELPVISAVDVSGSNVTVMGSLFGADKGTSTATVTTGGIAGGTAISSAVTSWSDTVIQLALASAPTGIIDVTVTTAQGSAHKEKLISVGDDVYEDSLAKPSDGFASDYNGALSSSSIMKGWGEYLYFLRETPVSTGSSNFAFNSFERYGVETGEWETLASLPEWLTYVSGCVWEGNFLVAGVVYDTATGTATAEEQMYMYNFEHQGWVQLDSSSVPLGAGIVNLDGYLRLVGGANGSWVFSSDVYEYDTGSGIGELVASLATPAFCPQLVVNRGQIFAYSYGDTLDQYNGSNGARHLQVVVGDDSVSIDEALPSLAAVDVPVGTPGRAEAFGSLAAAIEGLMLVGPAAADGSTDTFILDWDWESSTLLPYYRTASNAHVYGAAACIHDNMLYACAASAVEPDHCVFRATEMMAPTVESGNNAVWHQGSDEPLTVTFTPDYSRYYDGVIVDGVELYGDSEYYVTSGSTVVDLLPNYVNTLALGEHEMVVYFDGYEDGPGAEVHAEFTIEGPQGPGSKDPASNHESTLVPGGKSGQGYSRPAALAMTGDLLLIVPFAIIGIGAIAIGIYLVRRRMRGN